MQRVRIKEVKFTPEGVEKIPIPKGAYLQRIQIHLFGNITTTDKSVINDGGLAKAIKKVSLVVDSETIVETSGLSGVIKDIYDYKTYKDINRLDRQSIYLDLEDEDISEDGMISLLPTMHYSTIYLQIEWGKVEDIGSDIEVKDITAEIVADFILPEELLKTLAEELKDSLEDEVPEEELPNAIQEGIEACLSSITTRYIKEIVAIPPSQLGDVEIQIPEDGVCSKVLLITMAGNKLVDDLIDKYSVKSSSAILVDEISFRASQNQDMVEYSLGREVKGATMIEIAGDTEEESIVLKAKIKKLYKDAKIIVVAQYAKLNPKIEKILDSIYSNDEE